ncbi:MAG TPA: S66 peptidase family protein [Pyrinomonadaceae bacterium]|jgi:muramoyltetrapeptide carboxypeptidase
MTFNKIKPPRLVPGSRIGVVCPGWSADVIDPQLWRDAVDKLKSKGFEVVEGQYTRTRFGHSTGTALERADDLMKMFEDRSIRAIMAGLGGSSSHQLLPNLDYETIRRNPKIFIGFSDITALSLGIYAKTGLVTFNGPVFSTFCQPELPEYTEECFDAVIIEGKKRLVIKPSAMWAEDLWFLKENFAPREWKKNAGWIVHQPGKARGIAIGGEISTLLLLAGTEYMPPFDEAILFLEGSGGYTTGEIDRYFTHLRQLGVYEKIQGLIIGRFPSGVKFSNNDSLEMILQEATKGYDFPVVSGVDFSHTDPLITIPTGIVCQLDTTKQNIIYLEASVSEAL